MRQGEYGNGKDLRGARGGERYMIKIYCMQKLKLKKEKENTLSQYIKICDLTQPSSQAHSSYHDVLQTMKVKLV